MADPSSNWKNVNNWHWVGKNVVPWSKTYFTEKLVGVTATEKGTVMTVTALTSFEGDVDINQRKGKMLTIYDVQIKLAFEAVSDSVTTKGTIYMPEVMYDTEPHEIVITSVVESKVAQAAKQLVRSALVPLLRLKFSDFSKDLIASHSQDVYIDSANMNTHPALKPYTAPQSTSTVKAAPVVSAPTTQEKVVGALTTLTQSIEFVCSAKEIYETLTTQQRITIWTRSAATFPTTLNTPFSLYNGNITGSTFELLDAKKIVLAWRFGDWVKGCESQVTMEIVEGSGGCLVNVVQTGVPLDRKESTERNWLQYVWSPIKGVFGYGASL